MPELIATKTQKARKYHVCQLCEQEIKPGELYEKQFVKYAGDVYTFKMHEGCEKIMGYLWNYIDPHEGMTEEDFQEGVSQYCYDFVCPHCEHFTEDGCSTGDPYCLDKVLDRLNEFDLKVKREGYRMVWAEVERKKKGA